MADYLDYTLTPLGSANVNVPRATISVRVVDSSNQATTLLDLTGANTIAWPAEWGQLTNDERLELGHIIANYLIQRRMRLAGVS
jgi:hypothetical protein